MARHLLTLDSLGRDGIRHTLDLAVRIKARGGETGDALAGGRVGLLFDKPSTRTRVSFEAAIWGLGITPHFTAEGGAFTRTAQNEPASPR